jgi:hypothetical protein
MRRSVLTLALAASLLVGCGGGVGYYYASAPPPPIRAEAIGVAPGPGYVWINGYWGWRGRNYAWVPGYYTRPPRAHSVWVAPRWDRDHDRYRFREGRWR